MKITNLNIFIVEDDDGHAALIQKNLRRAGLKNEFNRFIDGQEIIDFFEDGKFEKMNIDSLLILLDIRMPKVTGIEVLEYLKSKAFLQKIPVIMITTTDNVEEINECHRLGCSTYIKKPIEYEDFIDTIQKLGFFVSIVEFPRVKTARS